ncbi:hypothetical protein DTO021D3_4590 [Paecilomyces variotii]|nr:hypothetical protein DTO032I3_4426 [Paecilomyces variotii]KAJ9278392.1 hypothetical protein DTO021D3_4590 [Paecilomyces variotii]KAJ9339738.1 hypothetical protein DTO027B6_7648 [Paecilomyces variotii]KAJ9377875.1 hypothetical protein DTO032I4_7863 [Paecilomyces variotii]
MAGRLPPDAVHSVATIDSQQGKEAKVVILDWVNTAIRLSTISGYVCWVQIDANSPLMCGKVILSQPALQRHMGTVHPSANMRLPPPSITELLLVTNVLPDVLLIKKRQQSRGRGRPRRSPGRKTKTNVNGDSMCGALICEQPALRRHIRQQHPGAILNTTQRNVTIQEEVAGQNALKRRVLTGGWKAKMFDDVRFTADDHRGSVAHSRMREVLVYILPLDIASGNIAIEPERLNSFGEIITSRIPYICHFAKWDSGERVGIRVDRTIYAGEQEGNLAIKQRGPGNQDQRSKPQRPEEFDGSSEELRYWIVEFDEWLDNQGLHDTKERASYLSYMKRRIKRRLTMLKINDPEDPIFAKYAILRRWLLENYRPANADVIAAQRMYDLRRRFDQLNLYNTLSMTLRQSLRIWDWNDAALSDTFSRKLTPRIIRENHQKLVTLNTFFPLLRRWIGLTQESINDL